MNSKYVEQIEMRKARDPKDGLCRGFTSWWEPDERRDLVGW